MKKLLAILLSLMLAFSMFMLVSCGDTDDDDDDDKTSEVDKKPSSKPDNKPSDNTGNNNNNNNNNDSGIETLNGKTATELYNAALEKLANIDNFEMTAAQVITMSYEGESMSMNQTIITKLDGQNCYTKSYNDVAPTANMEIWYVDEWLYAIQAENKFKANITWEKMVSTYMPEGATADGALMNIPESWFKDVRFEMDGDLYYIEFVVSGEEYTKYVKNTALGAYLDAANDVSYKVYFDEDGNLGSIITEFAYVVEGITCHAISTSTVFNIGTTVITAPDGDFTEVSM